MRFLDRQFQGKPYFDFLVATLFATLAYQVGIWFQ